MKLPNHVRPGELSFNMTPMIDIVFLLIIFFLVSSHLAKQEAQMELPLPTARSGEDQTDGARRLTLNVLGDGGLLLAGRRIEPRQLEPRLAAARAEAVDDLEVRIRSDRSVPYEQIEPLMRACTRAGIWQVTFGVLRPEEGG